MRTLKIVIPWQYRFGFFLLFCTTVTLAVSAGEPKYGFWYWFGFAQFFTAGVLFSVPEGD